MMDWRRKRTQHWRKKGLETRVYIIHIQDDPGEGVASFVDPLPTRALSSLVKGIASARWPNSGLKW